MSVDATNYLINVLFQLLVFLYICPRGYGNLIVSFVWVNVVTDTFGKKQNEKSLQLFTVCPRNSTTIFKLFLKNSQKYLVSKFYF